MALYIVETAAGGRLVRAKNGNVARVLVDAGEDAPVHRVTEEGPEGPVMVGAAGPETEEPDELEITNLSDPPGTRRFKDRRSGAERVEREDPEQPEPKPRARRRKSST